MLRRALQGSLGPRAHHSSLLQSLLAGRIRQVNIGPLRGPLPAGNWLASVDVQQLRAGHWSCSRQFLPCLGWSPSRECQGCNTICCPAGRCPICNEEADTPEHAPPAVPSPHENQAVHRGEHSYQPAPGPGEQRRGGIGATWRSLQSRLATTMSASGGN